MTIACDDCFLLTARAAEKAVVPVSALAVIRCKAHRTEGSLREVVANIIADADEQHYARMNDDWWLIRLRNGLNFERRLP